MDVAAACSESPERVGSTQRAAVFPVPHSGKTIGSQPSVDCGSGHRLRECSPSGPETLREMGRLSPRSSAWMGLWLISSRQTAEADETCPGKKRWMRTGLALGDETLGEEHLQQGWEAGHITSFIRCPPIACRAAAPPPPSVPACRSRTSRCR